MQLNIGFRYLLQQHGAGPSINQVGNSALACVLRHVRDWEFRYELLSMLLENGGDPNVVGRDGSVPLMVCLVPLINKDTLHSYTHTMKVSHPTPPCSLEGVLQEISPSFLVKMKILQFHPCSENDGLPFVNLSFWGGAPGRRLTLY